MYPTDDDFRVAQDELLGMMMLNNALIDRIKLEDIPHIFDEPRNIFLAKTMLRIRKEGRDVNPMSVRAEMTEMLSELVVDIHTTKPFDVIVQRCRANMGA